MLKVEPHPAYPTEEGRYLRGNDKSPVALAVILNCDEDKIPSELERLVRVGLESGAALSGTIQTANIGIEKMVCNIVGNPNIRYLVIAGPESEGHHTGDAIKALIRNGVDSRKRVIGTDALSPTLPNVPLEMIERFRRQLTVVDLQFDGDPELLRSAVRACYQEEPTEFRGQTLHDPGALPEPPMSGSITWRVTKPWMEVLEPDEKAAVARAEALMARLRARARARQAESQSRRGEKPRDQGTGDRRS